MTTRPTLSADATAPHTVILTEWNSDVLHQGRWTQEVLLGTNTDKIPDAALALTALGTAVEAVLASDQAVGGLGVGNWYTILSISCGAGRWLIFGGCTFQHTAPQSAGFRVGAATPGYRYGDATLVANTPILAVSRPFIVTLASTTTIVMDASSSIDDVTAKETGALTGGEATWLTAIKLKT